MTGPHLPGTVAYRQFMMQQHAHAMSDACRLMCEGASPATVADFVLSLGIVGAAVSRSIENQAFPGTFAEAVFNILDD